MKTSITLGLGFLVCFLLISCGNQEIQPVDGGGSPQGSSGNVLELVFTYGSEKEEWLREVTADFNAQKNKTGQGRVISVKALPMGSGESIQEALSSSREVHLVSPASGAFIKLGNAESRVKTGKDLVASTDNLVLSPVVIAMWKPMAEALGWGKKPIGWEEILGMAKNPKGWASQGFPQWGSFKFGHTHPQFSNSGLISLFAEVYAATGKTTGLTLEDIAKPSTAAYLGGIERSVVHYGSSTGFFGKKMFANGPRYLSAAVLYENMVIESTSDKYTLPFPVVAIYPKEGTFWSDHPVGIVEREWVTAEHREAAQTYIRFLLARPQQEKALPYGFRPSDVEIPLGAPFDAAHGVDPMEPKTTLAVPSVEVMDAILKLWDEHKKHSAISLVFDISGSMNEDSKLANAKEGALQLLGILNERDTFSFLPFSSKPNWAAEDISIKTGREQMRKLISSLYAEGGTALYDSIQTAYEKHLRDREKNGDRISAIIVLTDGADTNSAVKLDQLLEAIRFDHELRTIRVFTIGYGKGAEKEKLKKIADATQAKFYEGTPENIQSVFRDISTFF
ncbi:MAG: VWA domain-containing protein [Blastochloris sp.]|nr:VWA domain-containing protein [Blastochloris sp.]